MLFANYRTIAGLSILLVTPLISAASLDDGILAYENGEYTQALAIFEPLAVAGNADAQDFLGATYEEGFTDYVKARQWYEKAAAQGQADAQYRLAQLYEEGDGVEQDLQKALEWYDKAANAGDPDAQLALGKLYSQSWGDNAQAAKYLTMAAEQGVAEAQYRLGLLLLGEEGVVRDVARAWLYLNLASDEIDEASQSRDVLELEMNGPEIIRGKGLLKDWMAHH